MSIAHIWIATRSRHRMVCGLALALSRVVNACAHDRVTAPGSRNPGSGPPAERNSTVLGSAPIPIPATNTNDATVPCCFTKSGAEPMTGTGLTVPAGSFFRVRVDGSITVSTNPAHQSAYPGATYDNDGSYGPGGTGRNNWDLLVLLQGHYTDGSGTKPLSFPNQQSGTSAPDSAMTYVLHTSKELEVQAGGAGVSGVSNGSSGIIGMYTLSSAQTVTVEILTDALRLMATPTRVHPGNNVTFTASVDDGSPMNVSAWHFRPDSGSGGAGDCWWYNPCTTSISRSGTMWVIASIDGGVDSTSAHVTVYSNFTLSVDKSAITYRDSLPFDSVTFAPKLDGATATASRWRWVPDDTSSRASVSCSAGTSKCTGAVFASGTMWAYVDSISGRGDSASAHVTVNCGTGDDILDVPIVRLAAESIWTLSGADSSNIDIRRERMAFIYRDTSSGAVITVIAGLDPAATPCSTGSTEPNPRPGTLIASIHVHPFAVGDSLPASCPPRAG